MTLVLEAAVLGILTGGVYALMASGLTLIFGVMRIINVGHGALVILGAYLSFALWRTWNIDPFLSLVITMPVMFGLGIVLQTVFIRPLKTPSLPTLFSSGPGTTRPAFRSATFVSPTFTFSASCCASASSARCS